MKESVQISVTLLVFGRYIKGSGFSLEEVYQDMLNRHKGLAKHEEECKAIRQALCLEPKL